MSDYCSCVSGGVELQKPPKVPTWKMPFWGLGISGGAQCPECGFMWGEGDAE